MVPFQISARVTTTPYSNRTVATVTPVSTSSVTVYQTYVGAPNATLPASYLPSPTFIAEAGATIDDRVYTLNVPFAISYGNVSTTSISVSTNGVSGVFLSVMLSIRTNQPLSGSALAKRPTLSLIHI